MEFAPPAADASASARPERLRRVGRALVTPELIYGTILLSTVLVLSEPEESEEVLLVRIVIAAVVFWVAHVFAGTVAGHDGAHDERLGASIRRHARHSGGLLLAAIPPVFWLTLGVSGVIDELLAYLIALAAGVALLFVLGALAYAGRGRSAPASLLAGFVTAALGTVVIALKMLAH